MRTATFALPIVFGMGVCSSALAQEAAVTLPEATQQREISTRVGVTAEHHTNIAQTDEATARSRGIHREDSVARPMVELDVFQPFGRNAVFLRADAGYLFHRNNSILDSRSIDVKGGAVSHLGFCQAGVTGAYSVAQSELGELVGPIIKNLRTNNSVGAVLNCSRHTGFGASLGVQRDRSRNSAHLAKDANSNTDSAHAALIYQNKGLGSLQLQGSYVDSEFPARPTLPLSAMGFGDRILIRSVGVEYQKNIGPKLKFDGLVGRTRLKRGSTPPGIPPKSTATTYKGDLIYRLTPRTEIELNGERAITPSNTIGKTYDKETNSEIIVRDKLGSSFNVTLGARREDVASNTDGSTVFLIYTKARKDAVYGSIRYNRPKLGTVTLELRQEDRNTDKPAYDYRDTRVTVTLDAQF